MTKHVPAASTMEKNSTGGSEIRSKPRESAPQDTIEGCRLRASADMILAGAMDTENGRLRLERSAQSWIARASLLGKETSDRSAARAEWDADG